jgi:D-alanyl-D-alanine dipeptidase
VLHAGTLTARVTFTDLAPATAEAALARLVPQVAQRLRAAVSRVETHRPAAGFPSGA